MRVRKLVEVDRFDGDLLVFSLSQTTDRFWVMNGHLRRLPGDSEPVAVAAAVRDAAGVSQQGVPVPPPQSRPFDQLLPQLGVPHYATYAARTQVVNVNWDVTDVETVYVQTHRRSSSGSGFEPVRDRRVELTAPSPDELGSNVLAALDMAN